MNEDTIVAVFGRVTQVRDFKGLGIARITLEIPIEHFVGATQMLYDQDAILTLAPASMKGSPYGLKRGDEPAPKDERESAKGGPLSELAGMWCREPEFHKWMRKSETLKALWSVSNEKHPEQIARAVILEKCGIKSRRELDHDAKAARAFNLYFRAPYGVHLLTLETPDVR